MINFLMMEVKLADGTIEKRRIVSLQTTHSGPPKYIPELHPGEELLEVFGGGPPIIIKVK